MNDTNTPTPETDGEQKRLYEEGPAPGRTARAEMADLARSLERRLAAQAKRVEELEELLRAANEGLQSWTNSYVEESSKVVCSCCERTCCRQGECECSDLIRRIDAAFALLPARNQD